MLSPTQPARLGYRVSSPAANWIDQNLSSGAVQKEKFLGGSNWSSAYVYTTADGSEYFVKLAMSTPDDSMFRGEALGLQAMYGAQQQHQPEARRQQQQQHQQQQQRRLSQGRTQHQQYHPCLIQQQQQQ